MTQFQPAGHVLISRERIRQVAGEGWSREHDDAHQSNELLRAAISYTANAGGYSLRSIMKKNGQWDFVWPWSAEWWKPSADPVRDLVKAGALIAAEIDRLQRQRSEDGGEPAAMPEPCIISRQQAEEFAKLMAEEFGAIIQDMTDIMRRVKPEDIDRALGKPNGKSKANKKPAAKKPGQGRQRGAERQAAVPSNRGKRNGKGNSAKGATAGRRRGRNLVS